MQRTIYECDHCKTEIGKVPHISLVLQTNHPGTGVALPPDDKAAHWRTTKFAGNFIHLHDKCAGPFFKDLVAKAKAPKK